VIKMRLSGSYTRMALYVAGWASAVSLLITAIQWSVSLGVTNPTLSLFAMMGASLATVLVLAIGVVVLMLEK
jgi:hypothetical protein